MGTPGEGPHRRVVAAAAGVVLLALAVHFAATVLYVAPSNILWERHGGAIHSYMNPEFSQAWNVFAPDPPQVSLNLHARAQYETQDARTEVTDWVDISAPDRQTLQDGLLPTRAREQLRKSWTEVRANWDESENPTGQFGHDVRLMAVRIALDRIDLPPGSTVLQIQFRTVYTDTPPPPWTEAVERAGEPEPYHVEHAWWTIADVMGLAR